MDHHRVSTRRVALTSLSMAAADPAHFRKLEHMYASAPVNATIHSRIEVGEGRATVRIETGPDLWHAARSLHGSMYFKGLDDAAFFAANSAVPDVFVLTAHFAVDLLAPVTTAQIRGEGRLDEREGKKLHASAELFDADGNLVARGKGLFIASRVRLATIDSYRLPAERG